MVPDYNVHKGVTPPLLGTRGSLILDITVSPYSIYQFLYLFSLFYYTGEPADGYHPGDTTTTSNGLKRHKLHIALGLSHFLIRGPKKSGCRSYISQYGYFPFFSSFFALTRIPITFSRPTSQGAGCLHTAPPPS